jgi:hypothetical protein
MIPFDHGYDWIREVERMATWVDMSVKFKQTKVDPMELIRSARSCAVCTAVQTARDLVGVRNLAELDGFISQVYHFDMPSQD